MPERSRPTGLEADLEPFDADRSPLEPPALGVRSQATRQAIITAAQSVFAEQGLQGARLAAIARQAYVAPSTVSLHFGNKEGLFAACVDDEAASLLTDARALLDGHPYPALSGDLLQMLSATLPSKPLLSVILIRSPGRWGRRFYGSDALQVELQHYVAELKAAQSAGLVRRDLDPEYFGHVLARTVLSAFWSLQLQQDDRHVPTATTFAVTAAALFYPLSKVHELLRVCEPWRHAHPELHLDQLRPLPWPQMAG